MREAVVSSVDVSRRRLLFARRDRARLVIRLRGEHDASTAPALSEALAQVMAVDDGDVVVDMSEVEFMGAATVSVLCRARALLQARSRALVLRSPSRCTSRVLELCECADLLAPAPVDASPERGRVAS